MAVTGIISQFNHNHPNLGNLIMARKVPESINRLILSQQFALLKYMETDYVASGESDNDFAVRASNHLGFPVTGGNVFGCREALKMKSNRDLRLEQKKQPKNRLEYIEQRLEKLEALARELGWKI